MPEHQSCDCFDPRFRIQGSLLAVDICLPSFSQQSGAVYLLYVVTPMTPHSGEASKVCVQVGLQCGVSATQIKEECAGRVLHTDWGALLPLCQYLLSVLSRPQPHSCKRLPPATHTEWEGKCVTGPLGDEVWSFHNSASYVCVHTESSHQSPGIAWLFHLRVVYCVLVALWAMGFSICACMCRHVLLSPTCVNCSLYYTVVAIQLPLPRSEWLQLSSSTSQHAEVTTQVTCTAALRCRPCTSGVPCRERHAGRAAVLLQCKVLHKVPCFPVVLGGVAPIALLPSGAYEVRTHVASVHSRACMCVRACWYKHVWQEKRRSMVHRKHVYTGSG